MRPHPPQHEEFLARIVAEDDPRTALRRSDQSDCPECEDQLDALLSVASRLDGAGALVRDDIADSRERGPAVGEGAVEAILGRHLRAAAARRKVRLLYGAASLLGAAAALFLLVFWLDTPPATAPAPGPPTATLGSTAAWSVAPEGAVREWGTLHWRGPAGAWYDVRVFAADAEPGAPALSEREHLYSTHWTPPSAEASRWPARIRWEVRVFDDRGEPLAEHEAEAWLESH